MLAIGQFATESTNTLWSAHQSTPNMTAWAGETPGRPWSTMQTRFPGTTAFTWLWVTNFPASCKALLHTLAVVGLVAKLSVAVADPIDGSGSVTRRNHLLCISIIPLVAQLSTVTIGAVYAASVVHLDHVDCIFHSLVLSILYPSDNKVCLLVPMQRKLAISFPRQLPDVVMVVRFQQGAQPGG
jgi:hypothetical protein